MPALYELGDLVADDNTLDPAEASVEEQRARHAREALGTLGLDAAQVLQLANSPGNKEALKAQTPRAVERGIFGAPSFVVGNELFWGDDRLEDAFDWALTHG